METMKEAPHFFLYDKDHYTRDYFLQTAEGQGGKTLHQTLRKQKKHKSHSKSAYLPLE